MITLVIAIGTGAAYLIAYHTYGRWLGKRIFRLNPDRECPSKAQGDGVDYVPTRKSIVFGHHFTSIAGTGPIVGPAIAVMWGWLPALLWVLLGSIFIGAVHDLGSLVVSLRSRGQTIGDVAGRLLNPRVRILFLMILFMGLTIVLAIFGLVIAIVFRLFPTAIFPCLVQIPLAVIVGLLIRRFTHASFLATTSVIVLAMMYVSVILGDLGILSQFNDWAAGLPIMAWVIILLVYSYVASVLPVWLLLQPRDYINSMQLICTLGLVVLGLIVASLIGGPTEDGSRQPLQIVAPLVDFSPAGAPLLFPFLFVTIACGAISGFHCLVSSGTSSKQLRCESDASSVGYGSMVLEGFLATIVILACVSGLGLGIRDDQTGALLLGTDAWDARYASWSDMGGLGPKVGAFVDGAGNLLRAMGIPAETAISLMGVLVASFAATTLDTACRLQRYVMQELVKTIIPARKQTGGIAVGARRLFTNRYVITLVAVVLAGLLAAEPPGNSPWSWENAGKGGLILWPLFGATNQLLAGLAFLVIAFYLWRRGRSIWFIVLPMIFMLLVPFVALYIEVFTGHGTTPGWIESGDRWELVIIAILTLLLEIWMIIEALMLFPRARGMLEADACDDDPTIPEQSVEGL
ncbi:MAG: carbon starvation protein A [Phycisphaerae bacterium]|nr:carbon starvation protein A [Phycisphaerae bacterium]